MAALHPQRPAKAPPRPETGPGGAKIPPDPIKARKGAGIAPGSAFRFVIRITPMGKPRMTRRDKWKKRPTVVRYRAYADALRAACEGRPLAPLAVSWQAYFPLPASWSKAKKEASRGQPHRSKPDRDNIDKGILDALWDKDQCVALGSLSKFWDDGGGARIELAC
jgi:Holliday junction resolvase RusA-like endonuclease